MRSRGLEISPDVTGPGKREAGQIEDFSLVLGGPLYQLLLRSGLIQPPFGKLSSRIAVITSLAWLPLVPLTLIAGRFVAGVQVPFLYDFEVHARLLFSLPLMIVAELVVYLRMRSLVVQFLERQIITESVRPAFNAVVSSAIRLRNSIPTEVAMLLLAFLAGPRLWQKATALSTETWYATLTGSGHSYTAAGWWYVFVSVPVFQFVLLRWYYRIFIWSRFLIQVARLELNLAPMHPDRCCGLGFLGNTAIAFAPLIVAHSGLVAGSLANRIIHEGHSLPAYKLELVTLAVLLIGIVFGPLCVFAPKLTQAKLAGSRTYGRLASDYVVGFARKWAGGAETKEPLLGSADIQSLADLDNSFAIVREMRLVPFGKDAILRLLVLIALPLAPLTLTMISFEDLVKRLITVIL